MPMTPLCNVVLEGILPLEGARCALTQEAPVFGQRQSVGDRGIRDRGYPLSRIPKLHYYLLRYCFCLRARLNPYFCRSLMRESLVRNPWLRSEGLRFSSSSSRARLMPCLIAPT
ncbi:MAG: hypothetical protein DDT27_00705 [Dehalococcoidia bacterium]|nr:hypothetical protein [Chloroflexota bacterium]MBT9160524.1 hypothetical protein [Chloroflexota bacterium]MBT9162161.1 hypothetical protein [Chloroflexota bacterium]